jgi:hypothetical protein
VALRFGVDPNAAYPVSAFIVQLLEQQGDDGANGIDQAIAGTMGPDDYYDLLEGFQIGHRQIRTWVREGRAGEPVALTTRGRELARRINDELVIFTGADSTMEATP